MTLFDAAGPPPAPDSGAAERHARVVAAAVAAAEWARARRATWSGDEAPRRIITPSPPAPARIQSEPIAPPPVAPPVPPPVHPVPVEPVVEPVVAAPVFDEPVFGEPAPVAVAPVIEAPAAPVPIAIAAPESMPAPAWSPAAEAAPAVVAPVRVKRTGPSLASRVLSLLGSLVPPVLRWLPRLVVVALLVAAVMVGRPYWRAWRQRLTAPKTGVALLESVPRGSQVLVDGHDVGTTPLTTTLPVGTHTVEFRYRKASRSVRLVITADAQSRGRVDWTRKPSGSLRVRSEPTDAKVLVDGTERGVTPLTIDDIEAGRHTVVIQSAEGTVEQAVTVTAGDTSDVNETIFAGWLSVFSPFDLTITEKGRALRFDDRGQALLTPGTHEVRFENRRFGFVEVRRVDVKPGIVTTLSIAPPKTTLSVTSTTPGEVLVDGASVGQTPLEGVQVDLGTHDVVVKLPSGDLRRFTVTATVKPVAIAADFTKPGT